jgi:hypothetical protein
MKHSMFNRIPLATAIAGIILAFAGLAHAAAVSTATSEKPQKAKKGMLNITVAAEVGGMTLEPGEYEVKQVNTAAGTVVRFTRYTYNPYAAESLPVHDWEKIGEVKVTMRSLASKAVSTQLLLASGTSKPIGLEIRGNSHDYLF